MMEPADKHYSYAPCAEKKIEENMSITRNKGVKKSTWKCLI
jgi:hypothetical protein